MSKFYLSAIIGLLGLVGCQGIPKDGSYPADINFREAEKEFLLGDYQTSLLHYEAFIKSSPKSSYCADARYRMGLCYLALGNYDKAHETLLLALDETPYPYLKADILSRIAKAHLFKKEYEIAVLYYKKAMKVKGNESPQDEILFNLATALIRSNEWQEGYNYFEQLIKQYPTCPLAEVARERLSLPPHTFIIQLGSYNEKEKALTDLSELREEKGIKAQLKTILMEGKETYFIWAGSFATWQEALKQAEEIEAKGVEAMVVP